MNTLIVPIVPEGEGNTILLPSKKKQISCAKRWCFTLNNYSKEDILNLSSIVPELCSNAIIAEEVGESGTPHLQGYIEFNSKCRPINKFVLSNKPHWEKAKGDIKSNYEYCSKDNKVCVQFGKYRLPEKLKIIKYSQLYNWQLKILNIIKEPINDRHIYWIWSENGCRGKTQFSKYLTHIHNAICLSGKGADVRNAIVSEVKNFGTTPNLVVFPIPRTHDSVCYESLENIKDMYFYSGKYEGGMVCGNSPHLFVFANEEPDYERCSKDRWIVINIDDITTQLGA